MGTLYRPSSRPVSPALWRAGRLAFACTVVLICSLAAGCLPVRSDPERALALQSQAELLFDRSQIPAALAAMQQAYAADPVNPLLALRLGELYEFVDQPEKTYALYRKTLSTEALLPNNVREELLYRCGLLSALKLKRLDEARSFCAMLSTGLRQGDLLAVIQLVEGDARGALNRLNTVRQEPLEQTLAARIALHAAQAYIALGSYDEALALLYQSINLAGRSPVSRDVERVWNELKQRTGRP